MAGSNCGGGGGDGGGGGGMLWEGRGFFRGGIVLPQI